MMARAENTLQLKLPSSLLAILRIRNGGCPERNMYDPQLLPLPEIRGIAPRCKCTLPLQKVPRLIWDIFERYVDDRLYQEWWDTFGDDIHPDWDGKPRIPQTILLLCDELHWGIGLNYVRCGRQGEPSVVHVEMEDPQGGEQILDEIAPDFTSFLRMLYKGVLY